MTTTCGTCRHKGESLLKYEGTEEVPSTYFFCGGIKHDQHHDREAGQRALVIDGSGYYAALCVESDFGCNKWEAA